MIKEKANAVVTKKGRAGVGKNRGCVMIKSISHFWLLGQLLSRSSLDMVIAVFATKELVQCNLQFFGTKPLPILGRGCEHHRINQDDVIDEFFLL